jgi:hypothetical protein
MQNADEDRIGFFWGGRDRFAVMPSTLAHPAWSVKVQQ